MKKGFTLIELLAVIIILALVSIIVTPAILNVLNSSKESLQELSGKSIINQVELSYNSAYLSNGAKNPTVELVESKFDSGTIKWDGYTIEDSTGVKCQISVNGKLNVVCETKNGTKFNSTADMPISNYLPEEYQQVEYIESTGSEMIDTNYNSSPKTDTIEMAFKFNSIQRRMIGGNNLDGWGLDEYEWWYSYYVPSEKIDRMELTIKTFDKSGTTIVLQNGCDSLKHIIKRDALSVYWDNNYVGKLNSNNVPNQFTSTFKLFAARSSYNAIARIYYTRISNQGIMIRDLVPCYRKTDGVIGMYDIANNAFYTNQGSGNFSKGPNV